MKKNTTTICSLFLMALAANPANAADRVPIDETPQNLAASEIEQGWDFTWAPIYGWIPGIDGTIGAFGLQVDSSISAGDILSNIDNFLEALDGYYFGTGHLRNGPYGLFYDVNYLAISSGQDFAGERSGTRTFSGGGTGPFGGIDLTLSGGGTVEGIVDVSLRYTAATLAGTYRFYETPQTQLDAVIGARLTDIDIKVGVVAEAAIAAAANLQVGSIGVVRGATTGTQVNAIAADGANWIDAIAGVAGRHDFGNNWYISGWVLGGAGGSDYVFDINAGLGYERGNWSLYGGWRVVGTDYSNDSFVWDTTLSGPIVGLTVKLQ